MPKLYHVQDADRPAYVVVPDGAGFSDALGKWLDIVLDENPDETRESIEGPEGITFVADSDKLIL